MKVLQILQRPQRRGAEMFAAQLSEQLAKRGHELVLVFLFTGKDTLPFQGTRIHIHASKSGRNLDIYSWWKLSKVIKEFKPDIVQANAGDTLKFAGLSRFFFRWNTPLVFRNANLISGFMDSTPKRILYRLLLTQVDGVASVSKLCKADFENVFNWKKPVSHLPIGTDVLQRTNKLPSDVVNLLNGNPFVVHVGSFVSEKNHQGLLRIFKAVSCRFPSLKLLLCGDGPLRLKIESDLPPEVISLGSRQDISSILPYAKALLLPSLIEGLPGVILEAMSSGVAVIAYDTGGVSEVVIHEKTGFLISKGDEKQFGEVLANKILSPESDLNLLLDSAVNLVRDRYAIDSVTSEFEKFYIQLLNGSAKNTDS